MMHQVVRSTYVKANAQLSPESIAHSIVVPEGSPNFMHLETSRLILRELTIEDWPRLEEVEGDPRVLRYLLFAGKTPDSCKSYVEENLKDREESPRQVFDFAITLRGDDRFLGRCGMKVTDAASRQAMIWYTLDPKQWGKGIAPEAAGALITCGFANANLHRIWADIDPRNAASIRVVEKMGMRYEGRLRENIVVHGEMCDSLIYAVLAREWPGPVAVDAAN